MSLDIHRAAAALLLLVLAGMTSSRAQSPQSPVFRGGVDVVQLDVTVLDKNRQPVRGLTAADFTVLEDGQPQQVVAFNAIDIPDPPPPTATWIRDVTPDVATNELPESRLFVIVVDDALIPSEPVIVRDAKNVVRQIIEKLGPNDLAAVVYTADNRNAQDFTSDHAKLLATLDKFHPGLATFRIPEPIPATGGPPPLAPPNADAYFFVSAVATLGSAADYLIAIPHRRKALIWVSPGVPMDFAGSAPTTAFRNGVPIQVPPILDASARAQIKDETDKAIQRAQRANVAFYPIDPAGLGGMEQFIANANKETAFVGGPSHKAATNNLDFLQMAAENTGGHAIVNTNDFGPGIDQMFRENGSYYLLGFQSSNTKVGGLRRLDVKVNRPDVEVHARRQYEAARPTAPDTRPTATAALGKALSGLLPDPTTPMHVTLMPFVDVGKHLATVAIVAGVRQPAPAEAAKKSVTLTTELQTAAFTPEGVPRGSQRHTAKVVLRSGANGDVEYELLSKIDLPPGHYRLRLAAFNEASDRRGSVFADVEVPNFIDAPVSMSGIALGVDPGRQSAPKDLLRSLMPFVPTAQREFLVGDRVRTFFQVYENVNRPAQPVTVTFRMTDDRDEVRATESRTIGADRFSGGEAVVPAIPSRGDRMSPAAPRDSFGAALLRAANVEYQLPLDRLRPGLHLLTIEAKAGSITLRRDVRFIVE